MKKMNGFRKMMAWVLFLVMVCPAVFALALEPDVSIKVNGIETPLYPTSTENGIYNYSIDLQDPQDPQAQNQVNSVDIVSNGNNVCFSADDVSISTSNADIGMFIVNNGSGEVTVCVKDIIAPEGESDNGGLSILNSGTVAVDTGVVQSNKNAAVVIGSNQISADLHTGDLISEESNALLISNNKGTICLNNGEGDTPADMSGKTEGVLLGSKYDDEGNSGTVNINAKNITGGEDGIEIVNNTGTININQKENTESGNITGGETGIKVSSSTGEINIDANTVSGKTGIDVTGADTGDLKLEVTAENGVTGSEKGLAVNSEGTGKTNVDINAAVSVTGTEDIIGIDAKQATGTDGTVTVYADSVSVNQTGNADHVYGVHAYDATVIIGADQDAAGGVTVESIGALNTFGIYAQGKSDVTVEKGNVDFSGNNGAAIHVSNLVSGNVATVTVKEGDVIGDVRGVSVISYYGGEGIVAVEKGTVESGGTGINADAHSGSQNTVTVYGDVSGNEKGIASYAYENGSFNTVIAQSDVKSGDNGTGLSLFSNEGGENHILVEGTLSGGTAITLYNENAAANSTVTVWAAESKGEGKDLVAMEYNVSTDTIDAFTKAINYIVKLTGSLKNDNVSTDKGHTVFVTEENNIIYRDTSEDYKYHTANEEENVTLSFQLQEGEVFEGVYYNAEDKDTEGKVKEGANLLTVENGLTAVANAVNTFTLKMLRGGGMLLGLKTHTHDYSEFVRYEKEPTCTETGVGIYKCKYCDATITETVAINSDNHSLANGAAKAVTCTEDGWDAYQYCTRCSYSTKKVIEASGHDFEDKLTAGANTHWYACKNCDAKQGETDHIPGDPVKEKWQDAKAGEAGSYDEVVYCTACGAEISRKTVTVIPPREDPKQDLNASEAVAAGTGNPNNLEGWFIRNDIIDPKAKIGRAEFGPSQMAMFINAVPAGWKTAFTFQLSIDEKTDYTLKEGTLCLKIQTEYQKAGRKFAFLGMDKNGEVIYYDTDSDLATITADIKIEGYQFMLIYMD